MKNVLLIGVGGTGSNSVDMIHQKIKDLGMQTETRVVSIVFDTDDDGVNSIRSATTIPMTDPSGVGRACDRIGAEFLREWFPCDHAGVRSQELTRGASQWRKKSYFAFMNTMNNGAKRKSFHDALESLRDPTGSAAYEIYTVASIAGGTGSGSFIPITLYAKKYLREHLGIDNIQTTAMLACPDIYADAQTGDNRTKIYANAYAILRELNAMNQVVYGENDRAEDTSGKKTYRPPIHFRIGDKNDPYVGLLFDSDDREFWKPEMAPFQKVFLLDKIAGLSSITAHDAVMANSLYTILCTEVGPTIDSEVSNHAMLLQQSRGHNAIYGGIGTSEIRYPIDSTLNYLAHEKTRRDSAGEWLLLHNQTEDRIKEETELARQARRPYTLKDGEYAAKFLAVAAAETQTTQTPLSDLVTRSTTYTVEEAGEPVEKSIIDGYWERLEAALLERVPSYKEIEKRVGQLPTVKAPGLFASGADKEGAKRKVCNNAKSAYDYLNAYYKDCVKQIRDYTTATADAILPVGGKDPLANEEMSFTGNVLQIGGKYIHPVAAMIQLCRFKTKLKAALSDHSVEVWKDLESFDEPRLPYDLLSVRGGNNMGKDAKNSVYLKLGTERFATLLEDEGKRSYIASKADVEVDSNAVRFDAKELLDSLSTAAADQLLIRIYTRISARVDALIEEYRTFFNRFGEEREMLGEKVKTALRMNSRDDGAVLNVCSSEEDREKLYARFEKEGGAIDEAAMQETDHVAGLGVFEVTYKMACGKLQDSDDEVKVNYADIFNTMIAANREQIKKSNFYKALAEKNVVEALTDASDDPVAANKRLITTAYELAKPALQPDNFRRESGDPEPSEIIVFLMSADIARYLMKNKEKFGITIPEGVSEGKKLKSAAEDFIQKMSVANARVAVVDKIPSHIMYVTREVVDVQPTHVKKIDEVAGAGNGYYAQYVKAIKMMETTETDMWNPHLGFNLHHRGFLPFINAEMEHESDMKLMKALLYAIMEAQISFRAPLRQEKGFRFADELIVNEDGDAVDEKNLNCLITWLRPKDDLVEKWSAEFERKLGQQLEDIRPIMSPSDAGRSEADITSAPYMVRMRENLFAKIIEEAGIGAGSTAVNQLSLGLFEFANKIKRSEESRFDCDDAEKILEVGYDTFWRFCNKAINWKNDQGQFMAVYDWELAKFMEAVFTDDDTLRGSDPVNEAKRLIKMVNEAGFFRSIAKYNHKEGKFDFTDFEAPDDMKDKALGKKEKKAEEKAAAKAAAEAAAPAEAPAEAPAGEE